MIFIAYIVVDTVLVISVVTICLGQAFSFTHCLKLSDIISKISVITMFVIVNLKQFFLVFTAEIFQIVIFRLLTLCRIVQ